MRSILRHAQQIRKIKKRKTPWLIRKTDALCINTTHDPIVQIYSRAHTDCAKHGVYKQVLQCMGIFPFMSLFTRFSHDTML